MAKYLSPIDLNKNELRNAVIQNLGTAPSGPSLGQVYFDTTTNRIVAYNGSAFTNYATNSDQLGGNTSSYHLSRTNHTGTQLASTISNLASTVQGYTLDQFTAAAANVSMGGYILNNLADPTGAQNAATKNYVDTNIATAVTNAAAGIDSKPSVRLVATTNLSLSAYPSIDGVSPVSGDRILATAQTTASQNGVYVAFAGTWSRAVDAAAGTNEITPGAFWYVEEGTTYARTQWRCSNTGTVNVGTTAITIYQFGAAALYAAGNGLSLTGTNFAVQLNGSGLTVAGAGLGIDTSVVARKYTGVLGDGTSTSIDVVHNLATKGVVVQFRDSSDNAVVVDWQASGSNKITASFATAPAANAISVAVIG